MLEHWYFCSSLGLPPQTAATQLELLTALAEEPGTDRSEELVSSSIESLSRAGTATALYALPHVLAAQRRFAGVTEVSARASALYRDIASVAPEEVRARLGAALRAAGGSETPKALAALGDLLRELPEDVAEADPSIPPYHDLIEQLAPTATLVVARFLAGRDPRAAGELLDDHPALIDEALAGRHGRFALLQAAEVRGALHPDSTEKIRTALATASRGAFDMEPDLLATAARVTFPLARDVGPEETARTLDAVEREALSGEALLGWIEEWRRAGVRRPAGRTTRAGRRTCVSGAWATSAYRPCRRCSGSPSCGPWPPGTIPRGRRTGWSAGGVRPNRDGASASRPSSRSLCPTPRTGMSSGTSTGC